MKKIFKEALAFICVIAIIVTAVVGIKTVADNNAVLGCIDDIEVNNIDNWRSGCYSWINGRYTTYDNRLCLNGYYSFESEEYKVVIRDTSYQFALRELDKDKKFIKSVILKNGDIYMPSERAQYISITLYKVENEKNINYDTFKKLFDGGVEFNFYSLSKGSAKEEAEYIEDCEIDNLSSWRSGVYYYTNAVYTENNNRICLNDYKMFANDEYIITVSDNNYKILIRELDEDYNFLRTYTFSDGDVYKPEDDAKYIAVSLYNSSKDYGLSFAAYEQMFANGFVVNITAIENDSVSVKNESAVTFDNFYDELKYMLETGDMTVHDVSEYNMKFSTYYGTYQKLITGECYLAYNAAINQTITSTKNSSGKIQTVQLVNMDRDFSYRYEKLKNAVSEVKSLITDDMSDLEKTLIIHDYVVSHTEYADFNCSRSATGPLVYGKAICSGYTNACTLFLHEVGITAYMVNSSSLNHAWNMVEIGGKMYHFDATWDDTRSSLSGETDHTYFIRNDNEFKNSSKSRHYGWVSYEFNAVSDSSDYENWFVHDIVGNMCYYDGYWYYAEENNIVRSKIDGSDKSIVDSKSDKVILDKIDNGVLSYSFDGQIYKVALKN